MDAATYFFFNSTLLIIVLAIVFFLLGLWLGRLIWGKCSEEKSKSQSKQTSASASEGQPAGPPEAGDELPAAWKAVRGDIDSGKARIDDTFGLLYKERPDNEDDLTTIKGVGDILNGKLNDFGVYTFRQIASWNDTVIKEFSSRLSFKDRVLRDDWIGQCKTLHKEKYGEDLG